MLNVKFAEILAEIYAQKIKSKKKLKSKIGKNRKKEKLLNNALSRWSFMFIS